MAEDELRAEEEYLYGESGEAGVQLGLVPKIDPDSSGAPVEMPDSSSAVVEGEVAVRGDDGGDDDAVEDRKEPMEVVEGGEAGPGPAGGEAESADAEADEAVAGDEAADDDVTTEDDDSDEDDGVQVVIGDIKSSQVGQGGFVPGGVGVKRAGAGPTEKKTLGKFSAEDFEQPGTINGVPAMDFNLDTLEEKPWRKPGADITDYFNYGFTEETWKAYSERQKRLRFESGVPLMANANMMKMQQERMPNPPAQVQNAGHIQIPRIGAGNPRFQRPREEMIPRKREEPRENTIQVMTADRREYSRKTYDQMQGQMVPQFDISIPPPFPPPDHFGGNEFFNGPPPGMFYPPPPGHHNEYGDQWNDPSWNEMGHGHGPPMHEDMGHPPPHAMQVPPPPGELISRIPRNSSLSKRSPSPNGNSSEKRVKSDM